LIGWKDYFSALTKCLLAICFLSKAVESFSWVCPGSICTLTLDTLSIRVESVIEVKVLKEPEAVFLVVCDPSMNQL
jgi:hypothetical protein